MGLSSRSHASALQTLNDILSDFQLPTVESNHKAPNFSSTIKLSGTIPSFSKTKSQNINLSLIGSIPSLANALTAAFIHELRGGSGQQVEVDLRRGHNYIDPDIGMTPTLNGQEITLDVVSGNPYNLNIFKTKDAKYVVLSAVYVDLVYQWTAFLGTAVYLPDIRDAVSKWKATDLEAACAKAGMPMAICQTESSWRANPHGSHMSKLPVVPVVPYASQSPSKTPVPFLPSGAARPLYGLKVLCATHAIAGPSCGRTLAEHGASVLQIMYTHGFEHSFVYTYANLGTASTRLNFHKPSDRERMWKLIRETHVYLDSYRPGAISKFGFSDEAMIRENPTLMVVRLRCYGTTGLWNGKPGFDMQGSASSGLMGYIGNVEGGGEPKWPPGMVINDYTTGYFAALAVQSCVLRRLRGDPDAQGALLVSPSLTGTAMAILKFFKSSRFSGIGRDVDGEALPPEELEGPTSLGYMRTLAPLPRMSGTPIRYEHGLLPTMGSSIPSFPGFDDGHDVRTVKPMLKEEIAHQQGMHTIKRLRDLRNMGIEARREYGVEGVSMSKL